MGIWKAYFTGDIHGSNRTFNKLLKAGKFYNVQSVVLAGDLVGKGMIPIIKEGSKYNCEFGGENRTLNSTQELEYMIGLINDTGFYAYITDPDEVEYLKTNPDKIEPLMERLILERIQEWIEKLEKTIKADGIQYYMSPGNDDPFIIDPLINNSNILINPEDKCIQLFQDIYMITCGWTNPTPWNTPREISDDLLLGKLENLISMCPDPHKCIFVFHAPPYDTHLDVAPTLDSSMRMQSGLGSAPFQHVGSKAVRQVIEKYQPLVSVHGHIHESAGKEKIRNTWCFNHGSEYAQGILRGLILSFKNDKQVKFSNYLSVSG